MTVRSLPAFVVCVTFLLATILVLADTAQTPGRDGPAQDALIVPGGFGLALASGGEVAAGIGFTLESSRSQRGRAGGGAGARAAAKLEADRQSPALRATAAKMLAKETVRAFRSQKLRKRLLRRLATAFSARLGYPVRRVFFTDLVLLPQP